MNMASTRSHCIFTIYITVRDPGSNVIRKSKLHLVDLAGYGEGGPVAVWGGWSSDLVWGGWSSDLVGGGWPSDLVWGGWSSDLW